MTAEQIFPHEMLTILTALANHTQDAFYAIDATGKELFCNNRIERFENASRDRMLNEMLHVFSTGEPLIERYRKYATLDHREYHCLSSVFPVTFGGRIIAVCSINKNITDMHQLLDKAAALELRLQQYSRAKHLAFNGTNYSFDDILGSSNIILSVIAKAKKAASAHAPILICGDTGTGKELFAQSIHNFGSDATEPFVAINCAAIPDTLLEGLLFGTEKGAFTGAEKKAGLLEQAGKGSIFLDEIHHLSNLLQAKLLRVLQEMKVRRLGGSSEISIHCRIISSTNADCNNLLQSHQLREDFYYRIAVLTLTIPPLRERKEDIVALATHYLINFNRTYGKKLVGFSPEAISLLCKHPWPGNVRELKHVLESTLTAVENETVITPDNLPENFRSPNRSISRCFSASASLPQALETVERQLILNALANNGCNISNAARDLGLLRQNLQMRMKKLNIRKNTQFD